MRRVMVWTGLLLFSVVTGSAAQPSAEGGRIRYFGYDNCVELKNAHTRVVLCPVGGRVLEYSLDGRNAIALDPAAEGSRSDMTGGRLDIGPEFLIPKRPKLWNGDWTIEVLDPYEARMTSDYEEAAGVRLIRDVQLDPDTSCLTITQHIKNESSEPKEWCHWSRTFAPTGGTVVIPLKSPSRFPRQYVMYETRGLINYFPEDPNVLVDEQAVQITGITRMPKTGFDSDAGWMAYLMPGDLMFLKLFAVDRNAVHNEIMGLTAAIYYPDKYFVELEPVGPRTNILPGGMASFTEIWTLAPFAFPGAGVKADFSKLKQSVDSLARVAE